MKSIVTLLAVLLLSASTVRSDEPHQRFRTQKDVEEFVRNRCQAVGMPTDQMQDILQGIQATFDEPDVRAKFLAMSDSRRVFLKFVMDDYQFTPMCATFAREPPLKRRHRVEAMRSGIRVIVLWPTSTPAPAALQQLAELKTLSAATMEATFPGIEKMPEWRMNRRDSDLLLDAALEFYGCWTKPLPADQFQLVSRHIKAMVLPETAKTWSKLSEAQRAEWITRGPVSKRQSDLMQTIQHFYRGKISEEQQLRMVEAMKKLQGPLPETEKEMLAQSREMNRIELEQILRVNADQAKASYERVQNANQPKTVKPSPPSKP